MKNDMDIEEYLECDCHDVGHVLKVILEDDKSFGPFVYVFTQLDNHANFFMRVFYALRYVFGYDKPFGHWSETILNKDSIDKLSVIIKKYNQIERRNKNAKRIKKDNLK